MEELNDLIQWGGLIGGPVASYFVTKHKVDRNSEKISENELRTEKHFEKLESNAEAKWLESNRSNGHRRKEMKESLTDKITALESKTDKMVDNQKETNTILFDKIDALTSQISNTKTDILSAITNIKR